MVDKKYSKEFIWILISSIYFILYNLYSILSYCRRFDGYYNYDKWGIICGIEFDENVYKILILVFIIMSILLIILKKRATILTLIIGMIFFIEFYGAFSYIEYSDFLIPCILKLLGVAVFLIIIIKNTVGSCLLENNFFAKIIIVPVILYCLASVILLVEDVSYVFYDNLDYITDIFIMLAPCMWLREHLLQNNKIENKSRSISELNNFIKCSDSLKIYVDLFSSGIITQEEFNDKKEWILKQILQ